MKRGQATVFIIVAIVLVFGIIIYFAVRSSLSSDSIPLEFLPVFDYYQSCIELEAEGAIDLAGSQGGYISPEYIPGSEYAPFASHLNFLGFPVSYWYYVSGNGLIEENVPSLESIENEIEIFIEEGLEQECKFDNFYEQGFNIQIEDPIASIEILENMVKVNVDSRVTVSKDNKTAAKSTHEVSIDSKFGKFYSLARKIYAKEKQDAFLENYGTDVLYLYAPVDGVEIQCGPKIWSTQQVINDIKSGLEQNIQTIKLTGGYYSLRNKTQEYFVVDEITDESINFIYSQQWPTKIEVEGEGVDDEIIIAEPVGTQQGMGIMGFCYVPYHFVYDLSFPVLIQIYDESEIFQFGVVSVIDNNFPREGLVSELPYQIEENFDLCGKKTEDIELNIYDASLNPVDGNISYECFDQKCRLGQSSEGNFRGLAPACVNGLIHIRSEGYADKKETMSTNSDSFLDIILDREYPQEVEILVDGSQLKGTAIVSFTNSEIVKSFAMPEQSTLELSEGAYDISVYIYGNSSITIPSSSKTECVDVPKSGLLGLFGGTKEECFDINIPETKIDQALIGGGKINAYLLESDLKKGKMVINAKSLPMPGSLEELGSNFELFETRGFDLQFHEI